MRRYVHEPLDLLDRVALGFAQVSIVLMMFMISADAIGRYLFTQPLQGTYEVTTLYLMVILTYLGIPVTYTSGRHITLDVLGRWGKNRYLRIFRLIIILAVMGFLTWHASHEAYEKFRSGDTTFGLIQFPLYWSYVWFPIGCGLLALRVLGDIFFPRERKPAHD